MLHTRPPVSRTSRLAAIVALTVASFWCPVVVAEPVTAFVIGYLGGKIIDTCWDNVTGKPDIALLNQRLRELEGNAAIRADIQAQIRSLRERLNENVSKQQYLEMVKGVTAEIESIAARLNGVEERVERLEVELSDSKNGTQNAASAQHFLDRAEKCFSGNEFYRAIANCGVAISVDAKNANAYFRRAQAYYYLHAPPELTIIDYSEAIRLEPTHGNAYFCRSSEWQRLGDIQRAVEDATKAVELSPGHGLTPVSSGERLANRAYLRMQLGDFNRAESDYSAAISAEPEVSRHHAYRAIAYSKLGKADLASRDCETALQLDKSNPVAYAARCEVDLLRSDLRALIADASKCVQLDPSQAYAFALRGYAYLKLDELAPAESDFVEAIRLNGKDMSSRKNLEIVRRRLIPEPTGDQLPIDGTWALTAYSGTTKVLERVATVKHGELSLDGDPSRWTKLKLLPNGRYSALRLTPGVFSPWEDEVELAIDADGTMHQDDSACAVLRRSLCKLVFVPKSLTFKQAFDRTHVREHP